MTTNSATKIEFWVIALAFILIMSFGIYGFGSSLLGSSEVTLDSDSTSYLSNYSSKIGAAGITSQAERNLEADDTKNAFTSALGFLKETFDVFGVITLITNILVGLWTFISIMFTLPSFFIETLGLNVGDWKFVINILGYVLTLLGTIIIVRLTK